MATNFIDQNGRNRPIHFYSLPWYSYNGVEYRNSDFKRFMQIHTLCKNLVNFGPVTPEFKRVKVVHPLVDQQLGNVAPLLGYAAISTEF